MNPEIQYLFDALIEELNAIKREESDIILLSSRSLDATLQAIRTLREKALPFYGDTAKEIMFFKNVKPLFQSIQIYHLAVLQLELKKPPHGSGDQRKYFQEEACKLKHFFDSNIDFYRYWRAGSTHLDTQYFTRRQQILYADSDRNYFYGDKEFSTPRDYTLSKLLAYEMLDSYLMEAIEEASPITAVLPVAGAPLTWTAPKGGLIELIYAFQSHEVFNCGDADIRLIAEYFQRVFNVNLGNLYRRFQEIRIRKKSRSFFLDQLREKLIQRMDYTDEHPNKYCYPESINAKIIKPRKDGGLII
jgi:hypothetical protein